MGAGLTTRLVICALLAPACGASGEEALRRTLLAELNAVREAAGRAPVKPHPALEAIARDQASAVAASGGAEKSSGYITGTTRRLYRAGYAPHAWTEGSLIATSDADVLGQWRRARPEWFAQAQTGDFEDVGIGVARHRGRPVVTIVLALKTRTVEWRQADGLADLESVREKALAEVNRLRRRHGRGAVEGDSRLDSAAQSHAEDMLRRAYYDHTSLEGETVRDRARAAGYRGAGGLSENIAKGLFTPGETVRRWMNSSGHRRNILDRRAARMGLGVAYGENDNGFEVVWVQVFASR